LYLAAAGVGHLRIADHDAVELSNLQRQVLHATDRVGMPKVASAQRTLSALNPRVAIEAIEQRVDRDNVERLLADVDVVLDGSDNFATRFLLNDACVHLGKPLVFGAVHRFEGQVSVFWSARPGEAGPCYRCLFAEPPAPEDAPNCAEAGVLGVLPGIVGTLQAAEVLKLILGIGEPLVGRLLNLDVLSMHFREVRLRADPDCPGCGPRAQRGVYANWESLCASR
jgi:molybdopterin/thiamine biosynthesis adenylyltransferase